MGADNQTALPLPLNVRGYIAKAKPSVPMPNGSYSLGHRQFDGSTIRVNPPQFGVLGKRVQNTYAGIGNDNFN